MSCFIFIIYVLRLTQLLKTQLKRIDDFIRDTWTKYNENYWSSISETTQRVIATNYWSFLFSFCFMLSWIWSFFQSITRFLYCISCKIIPIKHYKLFKFGSLNIPVTLTTLSLNHGMHRKRTCLINGGLSHGCDYKDLMGAMEESNYWNSALSPGRRRRSAPNFAGSVKGAELETQVGGASDWQGNQQQ